jgi:cytochrome c
MLRALTIILVVIGIAFVAWSLLVMTGGRDWLMASRNAGTTVADAAPQAKPAGDRPAESKPDAAADAAPTEPPEDQPTDTAETAAPEATADAAPKDDPAAEGKSTETGAGVDPAGNPTETAEAAEKGSLKNPYADDYAAVAEEGHKKFMAAGCNGCHGGTGGGGMGPPLSNPIWVYGNDGDTLFRLIALGSDGLQAQGYVRKGSENVVGPMPPHGNIVKSNDDMWKIIAWIWSINPPDKAASAAP